MTFVINNDVWAVRFVRPYSNYLKRSDGSITIGMTDGRTRTVYIADILRGRLLDKVIAHELTHCFMFSYDIEIDIEQEEFIADFIATYGRDLVYLLDSLMQKIKTA